MGDATAEFFEGLASRGHEPALEGSAGTIRFDVADGRRTDHWLVVIDRGDVSVSRELAEADAVLRTDPATLDAIVTGRMATLVAFLRGLATVEGDPQRVVVFRRMFPGPPGSRGPRRPSAAKASS
jgi:putative sterol carrier protein